MADCTVANLKPGDGDQPIDIKVIRKWISFGKKSECCFIFIDKHGNAIQAGENLNEKNYFDSVIKVATCYRLSNYLCEVGKTFMVTVPHTTSIRLGKAALFQTIPDDGFPSYYFNFLDHDHLSSRLDNNAILTDYIGKLEHVTDVFRSKGSTLRRLKLENLSENMIDATFWDDDALSFNKEAVTSLPPPVIVVVTSMKVTQYLGRLQLTATPASYIYVKPEIELAKTMAEEFVLRDTAAPVLQIDYERSYVIAVEKRRNRFTLSELLTQNPTRYMGVQFTCKATLAGVHEGLKWFYVACDQCRKKLQPRGDTLACEDHKVMKPKHLYLFTATMDDDTAVTKATFFDSAGAMLLQADCDTLINQLGYADPHVLPLPLTKLQGSSKIFQMRYSISSRPGSIDFVVDRVFEDALIPQVQYIPEKHPAATKNVTPPLTTSAAIIERVAPPPATPAPATPVPTEPPSAPLSTPHCIQTKRPRLTSVKKPLFQEAAPPVPSLNEQKTAEGAAVQSIPEAGSVENTKQPVKK